VAPERRGYIFLTLVNILMSVGAVLVALHQIDVDHRDSLHQIFVNNQKFCQVLEITPAAPKPADPKANPSRERSYEAYLKVVRLRESLGCS
jgi:hypothetical protein